MTSPSFTDTDTHAQRSHSPDLAEPGLKPSGSKCIVFPTTCSMAQDSRTKLSVAQTIKTPTGSKQAILIVCHLVYSRSQIKSHRFTTLPTKKDDIAQLSEHCPTNDKHFWGVNCHSMLFLKLQTSFFFQLETDIHYYRLPKERLKRNWFAKYYRRVVFKIVKPCCSREL